MFITRLSVAFSPFPSSTTGPFTWCRSPIRSHFAPTPKKRKKKSKYKSCKWKFQLVFRLILTNQQRIKRAKIAESRRSSVACARWCKKHSNNRAAKVESLGSRKFYYYRDDIESAELIYPWKNHPRIVVQTSDARVISNHHDSAFF